MFMRLLLVCACVQGVLGQTTNTPEAPAATTPAKVAESRRSDSGLERKTWTVDGVERSALIYFPKDAATKDTPVVFGFHGHGGSARQAALSFHMHKEWPEAIVVYMDGLPTPGQLTDPEGKKNGWQGRQGLQGDRDLKFFDAVLETLKKDHKVDEKRIYSMGHSNGGGFTYLLWKMRGDVFAAFAPSGAFSIQVKSFAAKPAMHIAGRNDELVKFSHQERMIEAVKKVNGCDEKGTEWAKDCTLFTSKGGTPLVTMLYDGSHKYPQEAPSLIVKFFKEQVKAEQKKDANADTDTKSAK